VPRLAVTGPAASPAETTSTPPRLRISMMVTASISSQPSASGTSVFEVAHQIRLLQRRDVRLLGQRRLPRASSMSGSMPMRLDGAPGGRVVARRGQLERGAVVDGHDGLHGALAEGLLAHDNGAALVLQGAGDDLGRGGTAAVDQHRQRRAVEDVVRAGLELELGVLDAAHGVDDQALVQEGVADADRGVEHAAGVVAQVEHHALQAVLCFPA
jgi:hypothetical protein